MIDGILGGAAAAAAGIGAVAGFATKAKSIKKAKDAFGELADVIEKLKQVGAQWDQVYADKQLTPAEVESFGKAVASLAREATELRDKVKGIL